MNAQRIEPGDHNQSDPRATWRHDLHPEWGRTLPPVPCLILARPSRASFRVRFRRPDGAVRDRTVWAEHVYLATPDDRRRYADDYELMLTSVYGADVCDQCAQVVPCLPAEMGATACHQCGRARL